MNNAANEKRGERETRLQVTVRLTPQRFVHTISWIAGVALALGSQTTLAADLPADRAAYRPIQGAELRSVLPPDGKTALAKVARFTMRTLPVSVGEFQNFVNFRLQWRRDRVATLLADGNYLASWPSATAADSRRSRQPITEVSWFAAQAYCESEGARLPTWYEWELAAAADETRRDARLDPHWRERILGWYSRPSNTALPEIGAGTANTYGITDLHGVVWEWVYDFASLMVSADNREQGDPDMLKFCGAGALSMNDRENYAILMRVALLSSLQAQGTTRNLGFRCVRPQSSVSQ